MHGQNEQLRKVPGESPMTGTEIFNIIAGIITILSFVAAVLVWTRSSSRLRELSQTITTVHEIAGMAVWGGQATMTEDQEAQPQDEPRRPHWRSRRSSQKSLSSVSSG